MNVQVEFGIEFTKKSVSSRRRLPGAGLFLNGLLALATLLTLLATPSRAQEDFQNLYFAVGTVAGTSGQDWAYLLVDASSPELLRGKALAVYAKPGPPASASAYTRQAVLTLQTHPTALAVLLQRAQHVGEDIMGLDMKLGDLFGDLMPTTQLQPEEKLAIVIGGSAGSPELFNNLLVLSRAHPAIRMSLGLAHTQAIAPGQTTFEVRLFDLPNNQDLAVVGRVTVQSGAPTILPAPGAPVRVPETDPRGDLNVKLRWPTAKELRRLSLLSYGFNVYRINKAFAEENGYHVIPPPRATLLSLVAGGNPSVHRLNPVAVLANGNFDAVTVSDFLADGQTYFYVDDNDRGRPGSPLPQNVFTNGARFYYFATARDILGRDGEVSLPSAEVVVCDRLPPPAPDGVVVENDYVFMPGPPGNPGTSTQRLRVRWRQNDPRKDSVAGYYVYRWNNPADSQNPALQQAPISPLIPPAPGQADLIYVDDGAGAPAMPQSAGQTFWYTVRAVDAGACDGGNPSAHSAPAFGVLRDREGPPAPIARLTTRCRLPEVTYDGAFDLPWPQPNPTQAAFQMACVRQPEGGDAVAWAEFYWALSSPANPLPPPDHFLGRAEFPKAFTPGDLVNLPLFISRADLQGDPVDLHVFCRVGTYSGRISSFIRAVITSPPEVNTNFKTVIYSARVFTVGGAGRCEGHTAANEPIEACAVVSPTSQEFRFYRRIDDGPLTLLGQGVVSNQTEVCVQDLERSATAGEGCYYVQFLDENGNPSPMALIGCVAFTGKGQLPTPILPPPVPLNTPTDPDVMRVQWFAPPHGVDRFEVHVAMDNTEPPDTLSPSLTKHPAFPAAAEETAVIGGQAKKKLFKTYLTPKVGPLFGDGALFQIDVDVQKNATYTVMVRAVDKSGVTGSFSEGQEFIWSEPAATFDQVPWPARPLPVVSSFHSNIVAAVMPDAVFRGLGVRIGEVYVDPALELSGQELPTHTDPVEYLYRGPLSAPIFPVALYRCQVASLQYPAALLSGDMVQVSPLMERIAYEELPDFNGDSVVTVHIHDPFIGVVHPGGGIFGMAPVAGLYLLDTQPVVRGARYRYLLVRFDPQTLEMVQVIPAGEVTVP